MFPHMLKSHLGKSYWTGDYDKEEIWDGEVEQEPVGEVAEGGRPQDGGDDQEGPDGGEQDDWHVEEEQQLWQFWVVIVSHVLNIFMDAWQQSSLIRKVYR